jgi:hypothetical protein
MCQVRRLLSALLLLYLQGTSTLTASEQPRCGPMEGPDWKPRHGLSFLPGAGYSGTGGAYLSAGILYGRQPARCNRCNLGAYSTGLTLEATVGTEAARLSLGRGMVNPSFAGLRTRVTAERVWRRSGGAVPGDTFLGPDVQLGIGLATLSTGVQWRVSGQGRSRTRWMWAVGLGF